MCRAGAFGMKDGCIVGNIASSCAMVVTTAKLVIVLDTVVKLGMLQTRATTTRKSRVITGVKGITNQIFCL